MIVNRCVACGSMDNLNQHHLVPRSLGGSNDESNLLTLCGLCHAKVHQVQASWRHSELTYMALQSKKARNERVGKLPFGFMLGEDGVHLVPCPEEQSMLERINELRQAGYSLRKVADALNNEGRFNRQGLPWNHVSLHTLCKDIDRRLAARLLPLKIIHPLRS